MIGYSGVNDYPFYQKKRLMIILKSKVISNRMDYDNEKVKNIVIVLYFDKSQSDLYNQLSNENWL